LLGDRKLLYEAKSCFDAWQPFNAANHRHAEYQLLSIKRMTKGTYTPKS
jgi:hypothetical protein